MLSNIKEWIKNIVRFALKIEKPKCTCKKCNTLDLQGVALTGFKALTKKGK